MTVLISACPMGNHLFREEAERLGIPLVGGIVQRVDAWTLYEIDGVLHLGGELTSGQSFSLNFDWFSSQMNYRRLHGGGKKEPLAKAIGVKNIQPVRVIDATAGMGRESFLLANLGFEVLALERQPAIFMLLSDALRQAKRHESAVNLSLQFQLANSVEFLSDAAQARSVEVVYLDPMFPERQKSAAVKKDMRIFKMIAGEDLDADLLLAAAKQAATQKVVVKRPSYAGFLNHEKPSYQIVSKKHRFDVYSIFPDS